MFKRWLYKIIKRTIENTKYSIVITGCRRSGKTTLSKMFSDKKTKYFTGDDIDIQEIVKNNAKLLFQDLDKNSIHIIDEVQKLPDIFDTVKLYIDKGYRFILTGSSGIGLLNNVNETLAGRVIIYECSTCAWGEPHIFPPKNYFLWKFPQTKYDFDIKKLIESKKEFSSFFKFGGFPEIQNRTESEKEEILKNYRNTYLQRDILELSKINNLDGFRALVNALIQGIGSTNDYNALSREAGLSFVTTKKYLNTFLNTFLVFKLYAYQYGPAKKILKSPKWYFTDNGLVNSFNINLSEGQLFEQFIISELRKRALMLGIGPFDLYYYKTSSGKEIDFIVKRKNKLIPIEIKSKKTITNSDIRNLKAFIKSKDNIKYGFVFYKGEEFYKIDSSIYAVPAYSLRGYL